jgi:hypothetical protein
MVDKKIIKSGRYFIISPWLFLLLNIARRVKLMKWLIIKLSDCNIKNIDNSGINRVYIVINKIKY